MTQINPYLSFNGNCREAMSFYQECLGGELYIQTIGESPMAEQFPVEARDRIMHANLKKGSLVLLAADHMNPKNDIIKGNSINLCLNCSTEDEIQTYFSKLSADGKVVHPLEDTFWGAKFAIVTDKFGMDWMLNFEKAKN
ncbi:VOC family protein [bacterium]|nr:MAG: VOC family protein [bacterium]